MNDSVGTILPVDMFIRTGVQYPALSAGFAQFVPALSPDHPGIVALQRSVGAAEGGNLIREK